MAAPGLAALLDGAARKYADRLHVRQGPRSRTYAGFADRVHRLAGGLRGLAGTKPGDRVAMVLRDRIECLELIYAAAVAGLVIVPVNRRLDARSIAYVLDDCAARTVVCDDEELAAAVRAESRHPDRHLVLTGSSVLADAPDSGYERLIAAGPPHVARAAGPGAIYYTTGTTGRPKGAVRSEQSHVWMAIGGAVRVPSTVDDTWQYTLPFSSVAFYGLGFQVVLTGGCLSIPSSLQARTVLDEMTGHRVTHAMLSPTLWSRILADGTARGVSPTGLRWAIWGGMPINTSLLRRLEEWLPVPCTGVYGLTEAGCVSFASADTYRGGRPMAAGEAVPGVEFKVTDDAGRELPAGTAGEIQVRGSVVMEGYLGMPEETASRLRDGWFATGDIGTLDGDGVLTVVDRVKDLIISGGENIAPTEVESALAQHPGIADVAVFGVPDEEWGEAVCAVLVRSDPTLTEDQIVEHARSVLPAYMKPRRVVWVAEIPRNQMGKADKPALRRYVTGRPEEVLR